MEGRGLLGWANSTTDMDGYSLAQQAAMAGCTEAPEHSRVRIFFSPADSGCRDIPA